MKYILIIFEIEAVCLHFIYIHKLQQSSFHRFSCPLFQPLQKWGQCTTYANSCTQLVHNKGLECLILYYDTCSEIQHDLYCSCDQDMDRYHNFLKLQEKQSNNHYLQATQDHVHTSTKIHWIYYRRHDVIIPSNISKIKFVFMQTTVVLFAFSPLMFSSVSLVPMMSNLSSMPGNKMDCMFALINKSDS